MFMMLASILPDPPSGTPSEIAQTGITFFSTWIARIGGLVAFIGAIKFALSIKSEEAKEQLEAVLIMVSGFMIVSAVRNLAIFNIPSVYSDTAANNEFSAILGFIGKWTRRVGSLALLIGSMMFGFSIKDNNANGKVGSLKTISAGGLAMAVSAILPTFAYM
ncbi:MAG: hypothetical protein K2O29_05015 [Ruminococcus sp.]|nr:hypothetical protein [Ruminococcus sp.]MDE7137802.1 hypothetical protein [Ruminococcus sp.]